MLLISTLYESTFRRITKNVWFAYENYNTRKEVVCLFYLLSFSFFSFTIAVTTKTVNVDGWFESLESFISIISIFLNLWIWMNRRMNQTYYECYEFDVNVVLIFIATCNAFIHIKLVITTLQAGLLPNFPHHLFCVCEFYTNFIQTYSLKSTPNDRVFVSNLQGESPWGMAMASHLVRQ